MKANSYTPYGIMSCGCVINNTGHPSNAASAFGLSFLVKTLYPIEISNAVHTCHTFLSSKGILGNWLGRHCPILVKHCFLRVAENTHGQIRLAIRYLSIFCFPTKLRQGFLHRGPYGNTLHVCKSVGGIESCPLGGYFF